MADRPTVRLVPTRIELMIGRTQIGTIEKRVGRGWRYRSCWCGDGVHGTTRTQWAAINACVREHERRNRG